MLLYPDDYPDNIIVLNPGRDSINQTGSTWRK